jgi:hypothetical protein
MPELNTRRNKPPRRSATRRRIHGPIWFVGVLCILHLLSAGIYGFYAQSRNPICGQYLLFADISPIVDGQGAGEVISFEPRSPLPSGEIPLEIVCQDNTDTEFIESPGSVSFGPGQFTVPIRVKKLPSAPRQIVFSIRSSDTRAIFQQAMAKDDRVYQEVSLFTVLARDARPKPEMPDNPKPDPPDPIPPPPHPRLPAVFLTGPAEPIRGDALKLTVSAANLTGRDSTVELVLPPGFFQPVPSITLTAAEPSKLVEVALISQTQKPPGRFEIGASVTGSGSDIPVRPLQLEFYRRKWPNPDGRLRLVLVDTEYAPEGWAEMLQTLVSRNQALLADSGLVIVRSSGVTVCPAGELPAIGGPDAFQKNHWTTAFSAVTREIDTGYSSVVLWPSPNLPEPGAAPLQQIPGVVLVWCNGPKLVNPEVQASTSHISNWWQAALSQDLIDLDTTTEQDLGLEKIQQILIQQNSVVPVQ